MTTKPILWPEPIDEQRLPGGQAAWINSVITQYTALVDELSADERRLYAYIWESMTRFIAPVSIRQYSGIKQPQIVIQQMVASLNTRKLLWYDDDLRAILQCPPYSVLHTSHQVKAFGWGRAFASSFVDAPSALLVYGPNVWVDMQGTCPRSGEELTLRVKMREDFKLEFDVPSGGEGWCVWLPSYPEETPERTYQEFNILRSKINVFHSLQDLQTHQQYQDDEGVGVIYTLEQALYASQFLLYAYSRVLNPSDWQTAQA
ncbi:MAG: hypothetical protein H6671_00870 [Anaerolineaceae bacterium]|nr:hypothetical protein [Anaerolineaceae bacterium]